MSGFNKRSGIKKARSRGASPANEQIYAIFELLYETSIKFVRLVTLGLTPSLPVGSRHTLYMNPYGYWIYWREIQWIVDLHTLRCFHFWLIGTNPRDLIIACHFLYMTFTTQFPSREEWTSGCLEKSVSSVIFSSIQIDSLL